MVRMVIHHVYRPVNGFLNLAQITLFPGIAERKGNTDCPRPCCSSHAVNITFGLIRKLVVDDMGDAVDIDASGCDIRRHQHPGLTVAEPLERTLSRTLGFVAVDCLNGDATFAELVGDPVGAMLGAGEHDHPRQRRITHDIGEQGRLSGGGDVIEALFDALDRGCLGCHLDADRID